MVTKCRQLLAQADVLLIVRLVGTSAQAVHNHQAVKEHVLGQRHGIPYEVERTLCADCRAVLEEKPLRRAAA